MNENEIPYWKINIIKNNPYFPVLLIDNYYSDKEENLIWKELDFYQSNHQNTFTRTEKDEKVAKTNNGVLKGIAYRIPISSMFHPDYIKCSNIFNSIQKQKTKHFKNLIKKAFFNHNVFFNTNCDSTLITYYEDGDNYDTHNDASAFTSITWFYKQPKKFNGGDLFFEESNTEIECLHNRMIIFPGYYLHKVSSVKMNEKVKDFGYGRYSLTHFYWNQE